MTVHLPPDIESSIRAAIHSGRYASVDDAITEAATLLLQHLEQEQAEAASQPELTPEEIADQELQRRLLAAGVISEIKPPIRDLTPYRNRRAVPVQGEPISETAIRERR
jgi:Arc/MetJ-type ribon-helix-helix transcriptional regulator